MKYGILIANYALCAMIKALNIKTKQYFPADNIFQ